MNQYKFQFRFVRILIIGFLIFFMFLPYASGEVTEIDSNFDGKMDQWKYLSLEGKVSKVEYDTDYNGSVDQVEHYEGDKIMVKVEFDSNKDTRMDQTQHYSKSGKLVKVEKDSNYDGVFDWIEFFNEFQRIDLGNSIKQTAVDDNELND